ncbi:MAG: HK97 family phage prohead protease, partial [Nanoarchaeota archaeon]
MPGKTESRDEFVSRCIPIVLAENTALDNSQAAAICHSMYDEHKKGEKMTKFPDLLTANIVSNLYLMKLMGKEDKLEVPKNDKNYDFLRVTDLATKEVADQKNSKFTRRMIVGMASTNALDRDKERISASALIEAKDQLLKAGSSTVFFNHSWHDFPIGKVASTQIVSFDRNKPNVMNPVNLQEFKDDAKNLNETLIGLMVEVELADNEDGSKIFDLVRQGILTSFSIAFIGKRHPIRDEKGEQIETLIDELQLFEVSVVGIPANPTAGIQDAFVKSLNSFFGPERQKALDTKNISDKIRDEKE